MEPAEKVARTTVKDVVMVFAGIVAIVFGEFYRGLGWTGLVIFIVGATAGALAVHLWKTL